MTSDGVDKLFEALSVAQASIAGATKGNVNPHYQSKYADLAAVWEACRKPLTENGLSIIQLPSADGPKVTVKTILGHKSGQWIASELTMTSVKADPQGVGSALTYARRYALSAMVGIAPEDDDGSAASGGKSFKAMVDDKVVAKLRAQEEPPMLAQPSVPVAMLNTIKGLKEVIGDVPYRTCLDKHSIRKFSDIKTMAQATALLDELGEIRKEQEFDNDLAQKLLASIDNAKERRS